MPPSRHGKSESGRWRDPAGTRGSVIDQQAANAAGCARDALASVVRGLRTCGRVIELRRAGLSVYEISTRLG